MPRRFPGNAARLIFLALLFLGATGAISAAGRDMGGGATIGGRISGSVRLEGRVRVTEDLLVLPGAVLTVSPGTVLTFERSESTKVEPEYFFGGTEVVVRGTLRADGSRFVFPDRAGGIVVDGGSAMLSGCTITGAEAGVTVLEGGTVTTAGENAISGCRVGAALFPRASWKGEGRVRVEKNEVGTVRFPGAPPFPGSFRVGGNEEAGTLEWGAKDADGDRERPHPARPVPGPGARRLGDTFVERSLALSGDVIVDGVVRVAPGATLSVRPGSRIFFAFRDSDGDGIGENGFFLQGNLDARGTADRPIGFHPLDGAGPGRWDAINFMASDKGENILEHVEIAGGYRGLHAHFSRVSGADVGIRECYRGVQFQESEVSIAGLRIADCRSGLRCRDSDVTISGLSIRDATSGGNVFRSRARLADPDLDGIGWYGIRFRDSRAEIAGGRVRRGFSGISVQEGEVRAEGVSVEAAGLSGFAVLEGNVKISNCRIAGSRVDAVSATKGSVVVVGGELSGYGRYAVKLGGPARVTLSGVPLSGGDAGSGPFFDGTKAAGLGIVRVE